MNKERPLVNVTNIISRSQIHHPCNLTSLKKEIAFDLPDSALARIPIAQGKTKFSVFQSGSVISRASKSINELEDDLLSLYDYLEKHELELNLEYEITNIVAFSKLAISSLDLWALANQIPTSSYDPSAADSPTDRGGCGCNVIVYPLTKESPRKTILIFSTSAITLTGFRSLPDLKNQSYQFKKLLQDIIDKHPEVRKE